MLTHEAIVFGSRQIRLRIPSNSIRNTKRTWGLRISGLKCQYWIRLMCDRMQFRRTACRADRQLLSRRGIDMSKITRETFEQAVIRYFEPIAKEHGWPLTRRGDDLYEVPSP